MQIFDLSGRTALVIGGNQGIGFGIAKGLGTAGAEVIIANRRVDEGRRAVDALSREGISATAVTVDINNSSSIEELVSKVINTFGKIEILVNSAGVALRKSPEDFAEEDWDFVMNTNLKGLFLSCQIVGKEMIRRKKGKIINISSGAAMILPKWGRSVYATSKAGVSHLTRALAVEWAKHNITINAIAPGTTITPLNRRYYEEHLEELKQYVMRIPIGREAYPQDYIGTAVFFASDASNYVTGQTLFVDGGYTLC